MAAARSLTSSANVLKSAALGVVNGTRCVSSSTRACFSPKNWAFFGAPGVGKGTFASRVAPALNIPTISTGDLVRAEIKAGTDLGKDIEATNARGELVADEIIQEMVDKRLDEDDCKNGFILDGFPRTIPQAEHLEKTHHLEKVINFTLPNNVLVAKLTGRRVCDTCGRNYNVTTIDEGDIQMPPLLPQPDDCDTCSGEPPLSQRPDDTEEVILNRLGVYERETHPLVEFYEGRGTLVNFAVIKGLGDMPRLMETLDVEE